MPYTFKPYDLDSDSDIDEEDIACLPLFTPPTVNGSSNASYDLSSCPASPMPSVFNSMSSSVLAQAVRQEFGRAINNYSLAAVYGVTGEVDEDLDAEIDQQHEMFKECIGNYPPLMLDIMEDDMSGEAKAVLDLGCGSGGWIIDVARDFPQCQAVGVDLVPLQSFVSTLPSNCRSEVDDINLGLGHYYGDFDVVHAKLISSGIKDFYDLLDQITYILRPGGLAIFLEWDFDVYRAKHERIEPSTDLSKIQGPWWPQWLAFFKAAIKESGRDVDAAENLQEWTSKHSALEDVVYEEFWMPCSAWPEDDFMRRMGATMKDDNCALLKSGRPLLLSSGVPEPLVDEMQHNAMMELQNASYRHNILIRRLYARKVQVS
ncbi:hypothetical protein H0H87_008543 [Tephrocybe sp. NHM501043]|nr:hypothetical protein H0H87_008543 [Tephrocybe sp. NHM501043]